MDKNSSAPISRRPAAVFWLRAGLLQFLLVGWLVLAFVLPDAARAQSGTWLEYPTAYFTILYTPGDEETAAAYAGFVDPIYEEITAFFDQRTEPPINLQLYPTFESYYEVNPTARDMPGVVAHADFRRRSVAVVLPQTEQQTPQEIENNIRHELTHIIASELSSNRLNTGFQEGIAQYMELPTPELDRKLELLRRAYDEGRLMSWSDFEDRDKIYGEPQNGYPQSLSVATFLIDTYGFDRFRTFLLNTGESSGYRSALQTTYGRPPSELESLWRAWIPSFLDGSSQGNTAANYDLDYPRELVATGRYAEAQTELEQSIAWLQTTPQEDLLREAEALLARSQAGVEAEAQAAGAHTALLAADYARARQLVAEAQAAYAALGDTRQEQVLAVYAARIERGLRANQQLATAQQLVGDLRFPEARAAADAAASEFARLGDASGMDDALGLRHSLDGAQRLIGLTLLAVGLIGVVMSLWGRWSLREPEIW